MIKLLKAHSYTFSACGLTLLALYALLSRQAWDSEWMLRWNGVAGVQAQLVYGVLAVVFLLAAPFEARIRVAARRGWPVVLALAAATSFLVVRWLEPDQEHRLFVTPFSVWVMVAHGVGLAALAVGMVSDRGRDDTNMQSVGVIPVGFVTAKPLRSIDLDSYVVKGAAFVIVLLGLVLVVLHAASLTEFMYLDLPDEPFNGSIATNYAENNDLSSSYIGSAYGSPDVVFPRYYLAMGAWLKLVGSTSLWALRAFPLLVGGLTLGVFALALWQLRLVINFSRIQITIACVALMGLSTFVRTAHNLRMDILLALYGVLMLWGMLGFWRPHPPAPSPYNGEKGQKRFSGRIGHILLMGVALFLGMQGVPTVVVPISAAVGLMLVVWWLWQADKRRTVRYVMIYAAGCGLGIVAYYVLQFLPDIGDSWARYRGFVQGYANATGVGSPRLPLDGLAFVGRFSLILSPVELIGGLLALGLLWRRGQTAEHWMLASVGLGFVLIAVFFRLAYSYLVVFAPYLAYAVARVVSYQSPPPRVADTATSSVSHLPLPIAIRRGDKTNSMTDDGKPRFRALTWLPIFGFVFIPALMAAPIFDLATAVQVRRNEIRLHAIDSLTYLFAEGATIVGDDVFWFTLHSGRNFLGINGLINYTAIRRVEYAEALKILDVDALLCDVNDYRCPAIVETGWFNEPMQYTVGGVTYDLYWRAGYGG